MTEKGVTDDPSISPCSVPNCNNPRMKMRKYNGYGTDCQKHSICIRCDRSTNGWTCRMCESCEKNPIFEFK